MEIIELFRVNADVEIAQGQKAYLRNQFEFLGIKTPVRRELQKEFLKEKAAEKRVDWDFIWAMWALPEREFQYLALDYLRKMKKFLTVDNLQDIKKLAVEKSWWESVDSMDELVGAIFRADEALSAEFSMKNDADSPVSNKISSDKMISAREIIKTWSLDENFWIRRLSIDCQLGFKTVTDVELLTFVIENNLAGSKFDGEFFINKAIGWALRDFSKANPEWVREFITKNQGKMANLSVREGSKYL
jgi:3-methyladenine DNA glycosylase AlkD